MVFFLHPFFLTALACVGIPVLLHFLMRAQPQKLPFPALRFLQSREKNCRRSLRLRHWLLLAVRMLLIAFLVLLFARPGFLGKESENAADSSSLTFSNAPTAAIFLFDTSVRMDYVFKNQSRLELAQAQAAQILAGLPSQSSAAVLSTHLSLPAFSPDRGEIQRQIQQLRTTPAVRSIPEILPDALALLRTSNLPQQELFIFTDGTSRSWEFGSPTRRKALEKALQEFPNLRISIVDLSVPQPQNSRLGIPDEKSFRSISGGSVEIHSQLLTNDAQPHRIGLFLLDDSNTPQLRGEIVTDGSSATTSSEGLQGSQGAEKSGERAGERAVPFSFQLGGLKNGSNQGFLALLDGDALEADDTRGFTIHKLPPVPILLVANSPAEKNAFFVRQALVPMQFELENRAKFDCTVLSFEDFTHWLKGAELTSDSPKIRTSLERYQAILFIDPPGFSASEWNRLAQYVNDGGGMALFLGPALKDPKTFQLPEARQLLPAVPGFQARFPEGTSLNPQFQSAHPILKTFQELTSSIPWEESPVFRAWTLTECKEDAQTLFTWLNQSPAILSRSCGSGNVLLCGTPVHPTQNDSRTLWNLLPQGDSWIFLVLMNAAVQHLTTAEETPSNIFTQVPLSFSLRGTMEDRFFLNRTPFRNSHLKSQSENWKSPKSSSSVPPQGVGPSETENAEVILVPDLANRQLDIPALERTGNYQISGSSKNFQRGFSVNLPLEETALTSVSHDEIREIFAPRTITILENANLLKRSVSGAQSNQDLFNWLGLILLGLFLAENWLANRFYSNSNPLLPNISRR